MADNSVEIISFAQIRPNDLAILQEASANGKVAVERAIDKIQFRNKAKFSHELREAVLETYSHADFTNTSKELESLKGAGSPLAGLALGGLATVWRDRSGSSEIFNAVNESQLNELFGENGILHDALASGNTALIEEKLSLLDPDHLLQQQYELLQSRMENAHVDNSVVKDIQALHDQLLAEKNNPNKSSRQLRNLQKQHAYDASLTDGVKKQLRDIQGNTSLTKEQKLHQMQILLRHYIANNQYRNSKHFYDLVSKKNLFGRRQSFFSKSLRKGLAKKIPLKTSTPQAGSSQNIPQPESYIPITFPKGQWVKSPFATPETTWYAPPVGDENPYGIQAPPLGLPRIGSSLPGGGALKSIGKLIATNPESWPVLAIIAGALLFIIFIIVVIVVIFGAHGGETIPPIQLPCGAVAPKDVTGISKRMDQWYHIRFKEPTEGTSGADSGSAITLGTQLFNTLCLLFGNYPGTSDALTIPLNTFGTMVVGTKDQLSYSDVLHVEFDMHDDPSHPSCVVDYPPQQQEQSLIWHFYNAGACTSIYQFQFRIAQSLGYSLILQQKYLKDRGKDNNYSLFSNKFISGPFSTGRLPTLRCNNPTWSSSAQQDQDCFADMVGEYLTYPYYLDGADSSLITSTPTPQQ